jgi:hypothetical protein
MTTRVPTTVPSDPELGDERVLRRIKRVQRFVQLGRGSLITLGGAFVGVLLGASAGTPEVGGALGALVGTTVGLALAPGRGKSKSKEPHVTSPPPRAWMSPPRPVATPPGPISAAMLWTARIGGWFLVGAGLFTGVFAIAAFDDDRIANATSLVLFGLAVGMLMAGAIAAAHAETAMAKRPTPAPIPTTTHTARLRAP